MVAEEQNVVNIRGRQKKRVKKKGKSETQKERGSGWVLLHAEKADKADKRLLGWFANFGSGWNL